MTETNTNLTDESGRNINPVLGTDWISIEDQMPVSGKNVLVFIPMYGKIIVAYYWEGCWSDTIPKMSNPYWKVTHWMELPTPPTCA
jgi:hypothetical protein